jgi:hypothetical protein
MATAKKKKSVKMRDLKPSQDAKGGATRTSNSTTRNSALGGRTDSASGKFGVGGNKLN